MASGSRSPHASRASLAAACLLALATALSCSLLRPPDFPKALAGLDAALSASVRGRALDSAFEAAYRSAGSSAEWLSVLKRAREVELAGDLRRYARAAERALAAGGRSEALAAAAAHGLLRGGEPGKAYALFKTRLSPDSRPGLWAEAVLAIAREGKLAEGSLGAADFDRLAETAGESRFYLNAAVLHLAEGDVQASGNSVARAMAAGLDPGAELLWDAGRYQALAARRGPLPGSGAKAGSSELALIGDASWVLGDAGSARRAWQRSVALDPRSSW
ncbi:MAG TPA: hypothetical protein VFL04_05935, partial [Rectinemataceae bacterium]|nr:hypothetical protein [Rectinemataceae bacterium]